MEGVKTASADPVRGWAEGCRAAALSDGSQHSRKELYTPKFPVNTGTGRKGFTGVNCENK